jgi:hypothetical protein
MSTIGKILVVVNLALALLVLGAAGALLQRTEVTKDQLAAAQTAREEAQGQLDAERSDWQAKERQLNAEKRRLQDENDDLSVAKENAERSKAKEELDNQQLRDDLTKINSKLDSLEAAFQATERRNTELVDLNSELKDAAAAAKEAQRDAELGRRDMEDELAGLRRERTDLDEQITALMEEMRGLEALKETAIAAGFNPTSVMAAPQIEATLAEVDTQYGFVILDAGTRDEVARGYTFDVYRGGQWLGQVRVDQVYDDYSTARIVQQNGEMRRFDRATTHL